MLRLATLAAVAVLLALAPGAAAQVVPTGAWTGTRVTTGAPRATVNVTLDVETCAEGLKATLRPAQGASAPGVEVQAFQAEPARLRFRFAEPETGRPLACTLTRQPDGRFAGSCAARGRQPAAMALTPPAESAVGCSG